MSRTGDRAFSGLARGAGLLILLTLAGVVAFLAYEGMPAFNVPDSQVPGPGGMLAYLGPLVFGTVMAACLAMAIAMPLSVGVGLFISHYAPRRLSGTLAYLVDLLAAVPSVVYGLWGIYFLAPHLVPVYQWLEAALGFLPFFAGPVSVTGRTILTASIVLAIMVLPISASLCREVFWRTPHATQEAALSLGATRWEMLRMTVLPHARSGVLAAAMLGLGRALGETMAIAMVLSATGAVTFNLIGPANPRTIAANIALQFPEASGIEVGVLVASGLALFGITLLVNLGARIVLRRAPA